MTGSGAAIGLRPDSPTNALTEWARLLFGSLVRAGLSDLVISPGSRSTPFAWAALHTEGLRCRSIVDERCAGFFALGQARVTGRPVALLCTSGSAAAQYFPAVVEASQAHLPLIVITADRPFEVQGAHAPQSMDQSRLYGAFCRDYFELGHPESNLGALDGLRRMAFHAYAQSLAPLPGPVQLNARARKPLEPVVASTEAERSLNAAVSARLAEPAIERVLAATASPAFQPELLRTLRTVERGLIVCGPLPAWTEDLSPLFELAARTRLPVCVEAASQLRLQAAPEPPDDLVLVGALDPLLARRSSELTPEFVLRFGATPTSAELERLSTTPSLLTAVVSAHGWQDASNRARWLLQGDPLLVARELCAALAGVEPPLERVAYAERVRQAERQYWRAVSADLAQTRDRETEAAIVRAAIEALPPESLLCLGNSLPIRDVDAFSAPRSARVRVVSQRGVNGIDGLVSSAIGAAVAAQKPALLLIGDVSLLHDLSGLQCASELSGPLALLVIDNAGGRIFDDLPLRARLDERRELADFWRTPRRVDFAQAAAAFGVAYQRVTSESLAGALRESWQKPGLTLLHAVVEPDSARQLRQRLRAALSTDSPPP